MKPTTRNAFAFDLETHRIQPGLLAPPVVCGSGAVWSVDRSDGDVSDVYDTRRLFETMLDDPSTVIVGANIAYDMLCMAHDGAKRGIDYMPRIIAAYEAGRVYDIQIAEMLHAISTGHLGRDPRTGSVGDPMSAQKLRDPLSGKMGWYSLAICTDLVLNRRDAKVNDKYQESYALLENIPIHSWPTEARIYPVDDACNTLDVALAQCGQTARLAPHEWNAKDRCIHCNIELSFSVPPPCRPRVWANNNLQNQSAQAYAAMAMHAGAAWGFAVDLDAVDKLEDEKIKSRADAMVGLVAIGLMRPKGDDYSKVSAEIKRRVALAYGCNGACTVCAGTGKVASAKTGKPVGCRVCDSTGLDLNSAPVPRTEGSRCRTCSGKRSFVRKTKASKMVPATESTEPCSQCEGQPDVIPGCQVSRDALAESGDEDLMNFAHFLEDQKILSTYLPFLKKGISNISDDEIDDEDDE